MRTEVIIAGLGGQGVVLAGQILGRAAVYDGKNAVQTQSYGAEARGSIARSEVIVSSEKIGFPAVRKCNILVAMNQKALDKHARNLDQNGILMVDSAYVKEIPETKARVFKIAATEKAEQTFGSQIYANMVMLGALIKATGLVTEKAAEKAIQDTVDGKAVDVNKRAFKKGTESV